MDDTRLVTLCEVCLTPAKIWSREMEKNLIMARAIQCPNCKQFSLVPQSLKKELRKRWGMFN